MEILIKAAQLLLSLSILVIVHEFGHFITAKMFGTRVEKFYLFFDPWFSLFKFKKGETEYGIGWLPLGGYVKISGMMDESMDKEQLAKPAEPWEFRSKKTWQRLIIMLGGVTLNVILAFIIYIGMLWAWGEEYLPNSQAKYGIAVDSVGMQMGLKGGDKILSLDGNAVEDFLKIPSQIILNQVKTISVERDNKKVDLPVPSGLIGKIIKQKNSAFLMPRMPFYVGEFSKNSASKIAGMHKDDRIISLDTIKTPYFDQFRANIKTFAGKSVKIGVLRGSDTVYCNTKVTTEGTIGVANYAPIKYFTFSKHDYSFFQAIPAGFGRTIKGIDNYLKQLKLLFSKETKAYESVGGFISIGNIFPSAWDWQSFWSLTAFLSIMLAILNVLPIPALDGGHVMFLLYEMITGRKPSEKFMEYAQIVGMVLLLALLVFANGNDIFRLFKH
ncbi:MAG: RIP metalloprotease RseP [Bacteroidetes bacterium]|nr:RIP metalloprotease RseP [Bacteroidota bacterium]